MCVGGGGVGWGRRVSKICPYSILLFKVEENSYEYDAIDLDRDGI